jgi:putative DNA-invertase from lambdoid prophage Rac
MAVFGYARVSTARQASEGESLDVQRRMIEGYAHMHGIALDEIVIEEGVSGSIQLDQRPAGGAMLAKLNAGDIVIAAKLDRCFRSALDALTVVEQLKQRGVKLHLLDLGGDIAGNGLSKLFLTIAAAFAEAERDRIGERVAQVKADQKQRGRYLGGRRPFGYQISDEGALVEDAAEQQVIRDMIDMRGSGVALRKIAAAVSERGFSLSHEAVKQIIQARAKAA